MIRSYSELIRLQTFGERLEYLRLNGSVGEATFGCLRYLNQKLYSSREWKQFKSKIIVRDCGCNLAYKGYEIPGRIYIHHINPLTIEDLQEMSECIFDSDNVVCTDYETHNYIHYGIDCKVPKVVTQRSVNDTCPWKK